MENVFTCSEIKLILTVYGIQQKELAEKINIKRSRLSEILSGKYNAIKTRSEITAYLSKNYPDLKKVIKSKFGDLIFDEPVEEIEVPTLS